MRRVLLHACSVHGCSEAHALAHSPPQTLRAPPSADVPCWSTQLVQQGGRPEPGRRRGPLRAPALGTAAGWCRSERGSAAAFEELGASGRLEQREAPDAVLLLTVAIVMSCSRSKVCNLTLRHSRTRQDPQTGVLGWRAAHHLNTCARKPPLQDLCIQEAFLEARRIRPTTPGGASSSVTR